MSVGENIFVRAIYWALYRWWHGVPWPGRPSEEQVMSAWIILAALLLLCLLAWRGWFDPGTGEDWGGAG